MMKDHVSGSPDSSRAPLAEKKKERQKEITKEYPKEAEEHCLAKNKHKILKSGQKRTLLCGTKDAKARKYLKAVMAFRRAVSPLPAR